MHAERIERLEYLCRAIPPLLKNITEEDFSFKPLPGKWSKKEILGHLIDSATNNHQRFVRAQFEDIPVIRYDQNKWNEFSYYQYINTGQLIGFWSFYNQQLLELVKLIPPAGLKRKCNTGGADNATIEWLFSDYISHLEHHLKQIVGESSVW